VAGDLLQAVKAYAKWSESYTRSKVHERHPLCRHITNRQIEDLVASKLVTPEQVRAAVLQA